MRTTAVRRGDKYVINGSKVFISNGGYADWYTVYAKTDKDAGHRGISAFVVPRDDTVTVDKHEDKMGLRASNTAAISFNETEVPAENLLGEENHGFKLAMMTLDRTRPGVAAMATGIARAAFEFATEYSKERVQFGVPIAMHQAIQFMIADMATEIEAARLLAWQSAVLLDQGKRNTLQSSHAKRFAADTAMKVATDAVQIYGGYGFIKDYPVEKLMRDAKIMQLYEGTSQIQRLVIAGRSCCRARSTSPPSKGSWLRLRATEVPDEARTTPRRSSPGPRCGAVSLSRRLRARRTRAHCAHPQPFRCGVPGSRSRRPWCAAVARAIEPFDHGIWLVAYLFLVGFLAQLLLGRGQATVLMSSRQARTPPRSVHRFAFGTPG